MKKKSISLIVAIAAIWAMIAGCEIINRGEKLADSKGLSLYWNHQVFNEQGRGYVFEFYEVERSDFLHELKFEYQIDNNQKSIDIKLIDKIAKGKCPLFPLPSPSDENQCTSKGGFYIPEDLVNEGKYRFTLRSSNYTVQSEILFNEEKASLHIPNNNYFSSAIKDVFVAPKNLLYGNIVYAGKQNMVFGLDFIEELRSLGLKDTLVTNPPLIKVDETNNPLIESWPRDNYSMPFLLTMTADFSTIFDLAKVHSDKSSIKIYIFSTNGDQATLDSEGVWYAK